LSLDTRQHQIIANKEGLCGFAQKMANWAKRNKFKEKEKAKAANGIFFFFFFFSRALFLTVFFRREESVSFADTFARTAGLGGAA
jgi:hypothetical protein